MHIAYIANIRLPTEKAHGYQIMRVCSALAEAGNQVTLFVPHRDNVITEDPFAYYGLPSTFTIVTVRAPNVMRFVRSLGPLASFGHSLAFGRALLRDRLVSQDAVVISRDPELLWLLTAFGGVSQAVYNAHRSTKRIWLHAFFLRRVSGVIANSIGTRNRVATYVSAPIEVIANGSDPNSYVTADKEVLRAELGLPQGAFIALYAGHLYSWKGADTLVDAAATLQEPAHIVVLGGLTADIERLKASAGSARILFLGHKPKAVIPKHLAAADVLLLPNTAESAESREETSPLKAFEYMASGRPIIASDLPSLRRLLPESCATFIPPGDGAALQRAIRTLAALPTEQRDGYGQGCLECSLRYTWSAHAEAVERFVRDRVM